MCGQMMLTFDIGKTFKRKVPSLNLKINNTVK